MTNIEKLLISDLTVCQYVHGTAVLRDSHNLTFVTWTIYALHCCWLGL